MSGIRFSLCGPGFVAAAALWTAAHATDIIGHSISPSTYLFETTTDDFVGDFAQIGPMAEMLFAMDTDPSCTVLYAVLYDAGNIYGVIDMNNGAFTALGTLSGPSPSSDVSGLSVNPITGQWYLSAIEGGMANLYVGDITTGTFTLVGSTGYSFLFDIAIDVVGNCYGHDISTDELISIDLATGAGTAIGPTGLDAYYAQGMDFDYGTNTLYATVFDAINNPFCSFDLATGAATVIQNTAGSIGTQMEIVCMTPAAAPCPADVNGDGVVDVPDLLAVLAAWGDTSGPEDINSDGIVDGLDLLELLAAWGPCLPKGACCKPDGLCTDTNEIYCILAGGDWYEGERCATFQCPALPTGACCIGLDCVATNTEYQCGQLGGTWWIGEDCATFQCPLIYCDASGDCDEYIAHVQFGAIDNPSDCGFYQDFTALVNPMQIGVGQTITITNGEYWTTDLTTVWVDWNSDGDFYDAGEEFPFGDPGGPIATGTITAPAGAYIGTTRLRIRIQYDGVPDPCGATFYGEVEDYTVDVSP